MEIIFEPTYEAMSQRAAADLLRIVATVEAPLICPTSGSTPAGLYQSLVQQIQEQNIDYSRWFFVGLDEWAGMNGSDAGSCRHFVDQELFQPLKIKETNIYFFNGKAADPENECRDAETFIKQHGGITVAIVGLGLNGHVGMNEPGTPATLHSHIAQLADETKQVGQKYFDAPKDLSTGLTLGIATLLQAQHLFVIANGEKKAGVVKKVVDENPNENLPATFLKQHKNFSIYLDDKAAQLL